MKINNLMPMSAESRKLIDCMETGVHDALKKKYLKTLLFCICEEEEGPLIEEYAFSFSYPNTCTEEVVMSITCTGSKDSSASFKSNAAEVTPDQMRSSACKMIRTLVSLMRTSDLMPKEWVILVKLLYYNDVTPEDYEPPYFITTESIWIKSPLKLQQRTGFVLCSNNKKVKFLLDSGATHHVCNDEGIMKRLKHVKEEDQIHLHAASGEPLVAERIGSVIMKDFKLSPVGFIPSMPFNVVSVGQLASQGLFICVGERKFSIYDMQHCRPIGDGILDAKNNEYVFQNMNWLPKTKKLVEYEDNDEVEYEDNDEETDEERKMKPWIVDTGCAQHIVPTLDILKGVSKHKNPPFQTAKGAMSSNRSGTAEIGKLVLKNVFHCTESQSYLISGPMLDKAGYRLTFYGKNCTIVHKDGLEQRGVALQDQKNNVYYLQKSTAKMEEENDAKVISRPKAKEAKRRRRQ